MKPVSWNPASDSTCVKVYDEAPFKSHQALRSATVLGNRTSVGVPIRKVLDTAVKKYQSKAYLQWYQKYDIGQAEFTEAFDYVTDIVDAYESALF